METTLRIFLFSFVVVYFFVILWMLKKAAFATKYALIWLIGGVFMLLFAIFPGIVFTFSARIGISNPVNAVFFLVGVFTMILLLSLTSIVSGLNEKNLKLIQATAILEERVHKLEMNGNEKK